MIPGWGGLIPRLDLPIPRLGATFRLESLHSAGVASHSVSLHAREGDFGKNIAVFAEG